jgi:hypothetical protein
MDWEKRHDAAKDRETKNGRLVRDDDHSQSSYIGNERGERTDGTTTTTTGQKTP